MQTFLPSMKNWNLKSTHEKLSEDLKHKSSDFMFGQYYLQAIDFIEFEI